MMRLVALFALLNSLLLGCCHAFQPAVKQPVPPFLSDALHKTLQKQASKAAERLLIPPHSNNAGTGGLSSALISNLVEMALQARFLDGSHVSCQVAASSTDLILKGQVGPVVVKGKQWASRLGLTCRAIEATVDSCQVDVGQILSKRKLRLGRPATGKAMIALDCADFGNFLTHPLMKQPVTRQETPISFVKEGAQIDAATGAVTFSVEHQEQTWECVLRRGDSPQKRAQVEILATSDSHDATTAAILTESLDEYFNQLVFELDGTSLSFRDMMITGRGAAPSVMFALNISVQKLPSRKAAF